MRYLQSSGIYSLFQHGTISDDFLLGFWRVFQAKGTPYFEFEDKPFGGMTKRLLPSEHEATEATDSAAMLSSWPEPLLFDADTEFDIAEIPPRPVYQPDAPFPDICEELQEYNGAARTQVDDTRTPEEIQAHTNQFPPVNWTEIVQTSEARDIAWELEQVVFHEPDPAFAHLKADPPSMPAH